MSEERTPVSPEALAAAWATWHERHGGKLGPGPAFAEALSAGMAVEIAAAREAGRLEGLEEAIRILDALPRSVEKIRMGTTLDRNTSAQAYPISIARVPTVDEGSAAIRAKLEGK